MKRRTFLQGVGAVMGLPFFESLVPRGATGGNGPPVRLAFVFFPNGAIMPSWKPTADHLVEGLSPTLRPLRGVADGINVVSGLAQDNARAKGDGPGDHARCAATFLTGEHPHKTSGANIKAGVSVDQVAAQQIGGRTRLPSLELGTEPGLVAGTCDSGYSCAYSSNISWRSATTPMAKEIVPRQAFERLFGPDPGKTVQARRDYARRSILDVVADDARQLKPTLGRTDRRKLDEYFTSVRELELRIAGAEQTAEQQRPDLATPEGVPRDATEHIRLMYDLLVLAFQTDTTRVATFMLGNAGSNRKYRSLGVREGHHSLSHHRADDEKVTQLQSIDQHLAEQFAYFLRKLEAVQEGEQNLLHHSLIVYGSAISDGNRHAHDDLPIVLAGQGGGTVRTGRHLRFRPRTPLNNLYLAMLARAGVQVPALGDSSGTLSL